MIFSQIVSIIIVKHLFFLINNIKFENQGIKEKKRTAFFLRSKILESYALLFDKTLSKSFENLKISKPQNEVFIDIDPLFHGLKKLKPVDIWLQPKNHNPVIRRTPLPLPLKEQVKIPRSDVKIVSKQKNWLSQLFRDSYGFPINFLNNYLEMNLLYYFLLFSLLSVTLAFYYYYFCVKNEILKGRRDVKKEK